MEIVQESHWDEMTMEQLEACLKLLNDKRKTAENEMRRRLQGGQKSEKYELGVRRIYR